ncbi:cysteine hydrolase family protein [Aeromonas salmonicida]|uniref:cysteine hydrolase family protein n=1 Tax=Aeromonas salmonicida TaxID=645 RepID=UPI000BB602F6|nr:cysteine hydrolase family protein [Aeromonas salmonicida]PBO11754.1 cysteine hydrolase [Aeromonas salmonicida]
MTKALLIIDVQVGLFEATPSPYKSDEVISNINKLTDKARPSKTPIIWIQHETPSHEILKFQSSGWKLPNNLNRAESDFYVRKTTPDSFFKTDLLQILTNQTVSELVVCGYATEFCVDTTIRSAAEKGFQITLVSDTHTTHDKQHAPAEFIIQHHNATLPNITSFGVKIKTEQSALVEFAS